MSQKDQFADLLSSFSGNKKNDSHKMSLAERLRQQLSSNGTTATSSPHLNNSWSGLDLLDSLNSSTRVQQSTSSVNLNNDFDIFGSTTSVNDKRTPNNTPYAVEKSATASPLDDIFGHYPNDNQRHQPKKVNNNLFDDDEFTDAFTEEAVEQHHHFHQPEERPNISRKNTVPAPSESEMFKKDEAISELLEMGFEFKVATKALARTENYSVQEAISIIMDEAHQKAKLQKKNGSNGHISRPSQSSSASMPDQDELTQAMMDFTVDMKSKAFSLLSKGRKTLAKGIEMYKDQQFNNNDNQPAWMRNQATYKQQSMTLEGDEDEDEFDKEKMRRIVERQRAYDKQLKEEKERRAKLERQDSGRNTKETEEPGLRSKFEEPKGRGKFDEPVSRSRSKFDEPVSRSSKINDSVAPKRSTSKFDEPVARRRPESNNNKPTPPPAAKQPEEAFDIFNSPMPGQSNGSKLSNNLIPDVAISSFQMDTFRDSREKGNDFFKKGDFTSALLKYEDSLSALPPKHKLAIISLSNISSAQFKLGSSKECLNTIEQALELIKSYGLEIKQFNDVEIDENKTLKPIWLKLISRKAESLEHMEKFKDALVNYNLCIENGGSSKPVLDGKRRVLKVLDPPKPTPKPRTPPQPSSVKPSENLKNLQTQNQQKEKEDLQKFALHDSIELKLSHWKLGKEDNLRALLSSLHEVLWPELGWKPVSMTDLVLNKKVKINYLKAVSKTHPDKLNNATVEQKMIAQNVFVILNQSWDKFKESNGMT